jgi:hypothetical protein
MILSNGGGEVVEEGARCGTVYTITRVVIWGRVVRGTVGAADRRVLVRLEVEVRSTRWIFGILVVR